MKLTSTPAYQHHIGTDHHTHTSAFTSENNFELNQTLMNKWNKNNKDQKKLKANLLAIVELAAIEYQLSLFQRVYSKLHKTWI